MSAQWMLMVSAFREILKRVDDLEDYVLSLKDIPHSKFNKKALAEIRSMRASIMGHASDYMGMKPVHLKDLEDYEKDLNSPGILLSTEQPDGTLKPSQTPSLHVPSTPRCSICGRIVNGLFHDDDGNLGYKDGVCSDCFENETVNKPFEHADRSITQEGFKMLRTPTILARDCCLDQPGPRVTFQIRDGLSTTSNRGSFQALAALQARVVAIVISDSGTIHAVSLEDVVFDQPK